jgi:hypothetical protein
MCQEAVPQYSVNRNNETLARCSKLNIILDQQEGKKQKNCNTYLQNGS